MPFPLRDEVLIFDEQARSGPANNAECYDTHETPPRFLTAKPREFLLCFRHDHLARIEATVLLPAADAAQILAAACELWRKNAGAAHASPPDAVPAAATTENECQGRDEAVDFDGRLERDVDADADQGAFLPLTMTLDARDPT